MIINARPAVVGALCHVLLEPRTPVATMMAASDAVPEICDLVRSTLRQQPGFTDKGAGVTLETLCNLVEDDQLLAEDDDFERVYDACDWLEEEAGWLRVDGSDPEEDVLYVAVPETVVTQVPPTLNSYDEAAEEQAVNAVMRVVDQLKRFGVDKDDQRLIPELQRACEVLAVKTASSPAPSLRDDGRLIGDWELIGTTSPDLVSREGLTGLGAAPFTSPVKLFYSFSPTGEILAKEVLEFFGKPIIVNELRGRFGFNDDGEWMQEQYGSADLSGKRNSDQFTSATATSKGVCFTCEGSVRMGFTPSGNSGAYYVYRKLGEGEMNEWLQSKGLPLVGGTVATLDPDEMAKAYPYLRKGEKPNAGGDGGGGPFGGGWNPFGGSS